MDTVSDFGLTSWHRRLEVIAHSVRVKDVAQALTQLEADWDLADASTEIMEDGGSFGIVREGPQVLGFVSVDDLEAGRTLKEATSPIPFDLIVEESSPVLEVVHLFQRSHFFFGLRNNVVSSVMSWQDLDSMLGRIVVMALIMEFELAIDDALRHRSAEVIATMNTNRIEKAKKELQKKLSLLRGRRSERAPTLYSCLYLVDKTNAAQKIYVQHSSLEWSYAKPIRSSFKQIERVRNEVAHGGSLLTLLPEPADMATFFETIKYSIDWLRQWPAPT